MISSASGRRPEFGGRDWGDKDGHAANMWEPAILTPALRRRVAAAAWAPGAGQGEKRGALALRAAGVPGAARAGEPGRTGRGPIVGGRGKSRGGPLHGPGGRAAVAARRRGTAR